MQHSQQAQRKARKPSGWSVISISPIPPPTLRASTCFTFLDVWEQAEA